MKLIDLLVQELPKRGGWPGDNAPGFYSFLENNNITFEFDFDCAYFKNQHGDTVNRAQYETALAASQKVEWDGNGLPPVGTKCQIIISEGELGECEILFVGESLLVWRQDSTYQEGSGYHRHMKFRPIRSEADKKRKEAKHAIAELCRSSSSNGHSADLIYDAISAGKIPGVRIE